MNQGYHKYIELLKELFKEKECIKKCRMPSKGKKGKNSRVNFNPSLLNSGMIVKKMINIANKRNKKISKHNQYRRKILTKHKIYDESIFLT